MSFMIIHTRHVHDTRKFQYLLGSELVVIDRRVVVVVASSLRSAPETRGSERVTPDVSFDRLERIM